MRGKIKTVYAKSRGTYGSPRVHACLVEQGERVSRPRVARIMREHGIQGKNRRRFKATTNSHHAHPIAENRLERDFKAEKPDRIWAADITYLPTLEGWLYLAVVIDLFSRQVVGWSMSASLETGFVLDALSMAWVSRKPSPGLVHHSDRGVQYAARDFQRALERLRAVASMSRKGDCWDNAVVESFFSSLKLELDLDGTIGSRAELERWCSSGSKFGTTGSAGTRASASSRPQGSRSPGRGRTKSPPNLDNPS